MKVAITGATGFVGKRLIQHLSNEHQIVALSRSPNSQAMLANLNGKNYDWRSGDLYSLLDAERMLIGVDVAIYLVHSMLPTSRLSQGKFRDFDAILADNFARACEKNGVKQIIYLGGLIPHTELSEHLDSRKEVEDILTSYSPAVTILRAGLIFGSGGSSFEILYKLINRLPLLICPPWAKSQIQPVSIDHIINGINFCIGNPATYKKTYDLGGHEKFSYKQMMTKTAEAMNVKRVFISVPFFPVKLSGFFLKVITGAPKDLVNPLVQSLKSEMTCRPEHELNISNYTSQNFIDFARASIKESESRTDTPRAFRPPPLSKDHSRVKSVQRLPLPLNWTMDLVLLEYCLWLKKTFTPFLDINLNIPGTIEFRIRFLNIKMLVLKRDDSRCTVDRQLLRITGGALAIPSAKARLEFRELPFKSDFIAAIHDYEPSLPWYLYRVTQALIHALVMRLFAKHLAKIQRSLLPA